MALKSIKILSFLALFEFLVLLGLITYVIRYPPKKNKNILPKDNIALLSIDSASPKDIPITTPTFIPTLIPTLVSRLINYSNPDYSYEISHPRNWDGVLDSSQPDTLQTYSIYSPNNKDSIQILVRKGTWSDVKRQLSTGKNTTISGQPAFINTSAQGQKTFTISSIISNQIIQITVTGNSSQINDIISSFKFLQ